MAIGGRNETPQMLGFSGLVVKYWFKSGLLVI